MPTMKVLLDGPELALIKASLLGTAETAVQLGFNQTMDRCHDLVRMLDMVSAHTALEITEARKRADATGHRVQADDFVNGWFHDREQCPPFPGPRRSAFQAGWVEGTIRRSGGAAQRVTDYLNALRSDGGFEPSEEAAFLGVIKAIDGEPEPEPAGEDPF